MSQSNIDFTVQIDIIHQPTGDFVDFTTKRKFAFREDAQKFINSFQQCLREEPVNDLIIRSTINKNQNIYSIYNIANKLNNEINYHDITYTCEWEKYKKGWLLVPQYDTNPDYGTKYYCGGWWMQTKNAWFFRKEQALDFYTEFSKLHPDF